MPVGTIRRGLTSLKLAGSPNSVPGLDPSFQNSGALAGCTVCAAAAAAAAGTASTASDACSLACTFSMDVRAAGGEVQVQVQVQVQVLVLCSQEDRGAVRGVVMVARRSGRTRGQLLPL